MQPSTYQKRVLELLPWFLKASQEEKDACTERDEVQALETLLSTKEAHVQINNLDIEKNTMYSALHAWEGEMRAMQEDREEKEAELEVGASEIERVMTVTHPTGFILYPPENLKCILYQRCVKVPCSKI